MIRISVTELKTNAGKYISMVDTQDIFITKNGRLVARLTTARPDKVGAAKSLFGLIHDCNDLDSERKEHLL